MIAKFLLVAALVLLPFLPSVSAAQTLISVAVSPSTVDRYEVFVITVATAFPNSTFALTISGPAFVQDLNGTTSSVGIWENRLSAALDFGSYTVFATGLNQTAQTSFVVGCSARCVVDIQNTWGRYIVELLANAIVQILIVLTVILLIIEGPKTAHYFWKAGIAATKRGRLTAGDILRSPLAALQGFVQPGRQSMKLDVNDRVALDLERRALVEELHDSTRAKFLEYDPDHIAAVESIVQDLKAAYDREARVIANPPPLAHKFERTGDVTGMAEDMETERWLTKERTNGGESDTRTEAVDTWTAAKRLAKDRRARAYRVSKILFATLGLPALLMAALGPLAYAGIYIEPLRPLWRPWLGDDGKFALGVAGFLVFAGLLAIARMRAHIPRE